jgi:hypothetical protein
MPLQVGHFTLDNVENNATFMVELELLLTAGVLNSR